MIVLKEDKKDVHVYVDDFTGDKYVFDGTKLYKLNMDGQSGNGSGGGLEIDSDKPSQQQSQNGQQGQSSSSSSGQHSQQQGGSSSNNGQKQDQEQGDEQEGSSSRKGDKSSDDKKDSKSGSPLQIGDKGDEDALAKEDAEREAKAAAERAERGEKGETEEEKKARIQKITDMLNDKKRGEELVMDQQERVETEKRKRAKAQAEREKKKQLGYNPTELEKFKMDLKRFIANQVDAEVRNVTWRKYNSNYANSGILRPGHRNEKLGKIPVLDVFVDQSGSFGDSDIKMVNDALAYIYKYEEKHLLKINVYYFANNIYSSPGPARAEGGTSAGPQILEQIRSTKPTNVIIFTDSDPDHNTMDEERVVVPGGVWQVYRSSQSRAFIQNLKGKKSTQIYLI